MGTKDEVGKVEYHYGFYGAIHAEYEPTHVKMEYLQEHELGDEPVRLDMLLLKLEQKRLTDPIGSFFRGHNVLEYKSPEDSLTISDFYKAQGYALLYKGLEEHADDIPLSELTVSVFRHAYPREMFRKLRDQGITIQEAFHGVYRVSGPLSVQTQVVVTSQLPEGSYSTFKVLAKHASQEDILTVLNMAVEDDVRMSDYIRAIMNVSVVINESTIRAIKEEGLMSDAVRRVFKEELEEQWNAGRQDGWNAGRQDGWNAGRNELSEEIYKRMRKANIPEDQARELAFG